MSSTRRAPEGSELRQNRYCSSTAIEKGLLANLVSKRLSTLNSAEERELVLSLQYLSHQKGGLGDVVTELVRSFPERICTPNMARFGTEPGRIYTQDEVKAIREEIPGANFPLKGELSPFEMFAAPEPADYWEKLPGSDFQKEAMRLEESAAKHPTTYPAAHFLQRCREAAEEKLEELLARMCLDPALDLEAVRPWYFPSLVESLTVFLDNRRKAIIAATVVTSIGNAIRETVEYGCATRSMVIIEGEMRTGKSFAAKALCEMFPGRYRYVQVPPTADDIGFFKACAEALGLSKRTTFKAVELRERLSAVLQESGLMLVFDEAHYIFPIHTRISSLPTRANWIVCELVNQQLPCALVITEQFEERLRHVVDQTGWKAGQLLYRAGQRVQLPSKLTLPELQAIAKFHLPQADQAMIVRLATYGAVSPGGCASIAFRATRAKYLAEAEGRALPAYRDVVRAIEEDALPAMESPKRKRPRPHVKPEITEEQPEPLSRHRDSSEVFSIRQNISHWL